MPTTVDREEWIKLAEVSSNLKHYQTIADRNPGYVALHRRIAVVSQVVFAVPISRKSFVLYMNHEITELVAFLARSGCDGEFLNEEAWTKEEGQGCALALKPTIVVKRGKHGNEKIIIKKMVHCAGRCPQKGHKCVTRRIPSDRGMIANCNCHP